MISIDARRVVSSCDKQKNRDDIVFLYNRRAAVHDQCVARYAGHEEERCM